MDLNIDGMHCGACASRIERVLSRKPGVDSASVNFATRKARVEGSLTLEEISSVVAELGYAAVIADAHIKAESSTVERTEFLLSAALATPVFILGMFHLNFTGSGAIQLVLTTVLILFPGRQFFSRSARLLVRGGVNMDTLISLGVAAAYGTSVVELVRGTHQYYFEAAAVIIAFVLLGRYLEKKARGSAIAVVDSLKRMGAKDAIVILSDGTQSVRNIEDLKVGDTVLVSPGEKIPADGKITRGNSVVDESLISGEPLPKEKGAGCEVISSTINVGSEPLYVLCLKTGSDSMFSKVVTLVEDAQASKAHIQRIADAVSAVFVPVVICIAFLTILIHVYYFSSSVQDAIYFGVAVLVVACPCALGLATPVAILVGTGRAATDMILIKTAAGLEKTVSVDTIVFDKTGTLTEGAPTVVDVVWFGSAKDNQNFLELAGSAERKSKHPLAMALVNYVESQGFSTSLDCETKEIFGRGITATFNDETGARKFVAGNMQLMDEEGISGLQKVDTLRFKDAGVIYCALAGDLVAAFLVDDPLRPDVAGVISGLHKMKIRVVMATGDREAVAARIAALTGIDEVHASMLPADKLSLLQKLQAEGRVVAMVGDGINDAPALAAATVGIAIGNGADIALDAADLIIPDGSIGKIMLAIEISRKTLRTIKENLFWAFAYNILAIPMAASGKLSPMLAAAAMGLSSVTVVLNSLRLKKA